MRESRRYLVPISGLFSAVLIISLILAGKIVTLGGLTFSAAVIVFPLSYVFGDVLARLKLRLAGRWLALRLVVSTMVGQGIDTLIFVSIAFGGVFGAQELLRIGLGAWVLKVVWEIVALPLTLPLIAWFKREEGEDHYDRDTNFNPFRLRA